MDIYAFICIFIATLAGVLPPGTIFITLPAHILINYHHSFLVGLLEMKAKLYNFSL